MTEETVWRSSGAYEVEDRATHYVVEYFTSEMVWLTDWRRESGMYYTLDEATAEAMSLDGKVVDDWCGERIIATRVRKITP